MSPLSKYDYCRQYLKSQLRLGQDVLPKVCVCVCVCVCAVAQLGPTLCKPMNLIHQVPLSLGFPRQEYWGGLHYLLQGIFPT